MKAKENFSINPENKEAIEKAKKSLKKGKLDLFNMITKGENSVSSTRVGSFPDTTYVRR